MFCKLCDTPVNISKINKPLKDILLDHKICENCFHKINRSFMKTYNINTKQWWWIRGKNPNKICILCGKDARPSGDRPLCNSRTCNSKYYSMKVEREKLLKILGNGNDFTDLNYTINSIKKLGFEVIIKSLPLEKTFLSPSPTC